MIGSNARAKVSCGRCAGRHVMLCRIDETGGWDRATSKIIKILALKSIKLSRMSMLPSKLRAGKDGRRYVHCTPRYNPNERPDLGQVFRMTTYHVVLNEEIYVRMKMNIDKWLPDHKPIWTCIGVAKLAFPGMNVEIEVAAYDPK